MAKDPRLIAKKAKTSHQSAWWYEDKVGVWVYIQSRNGTVEACIGWAALLRAAQRSARGREVLVRRIGK